MRTLLKKNGWGLIEMLTAVALIALLVVLSLPVLSRVMANMRDQSAIASLWAILEAQKSYRDAQTPTTYANTIGDLVNDEYLSGKFLNDSSYEYRLSATSNTFTAEVVRDGIILASISHIGNLTYGGGGAEDGGSGGGDGGGGRGGGEQISCPYLYIWNGFAFVKENDLNPGGDIERGLGEYTDFYLLMKKVVPQRNQYLFQIREEVEEISWINAVRLVSIDHPRSVQVAPSPEGVIWTYREKDLQKPLSVYTDKGEDAAPLLSDVGKRFYHGRAGNYLIVNFGEVRDLENGVRLIMSADPMMIPEKSIHLFAWVEERRWIPVAQIHPHEKWDRWAVDLTEIARKRKGQALLLKFALTDEHRIDFAMLDTSPQAEVFVREVPPLTMHHSRRGDVSEALKKTDQEVTELVKEDTLTLTFKRTPLQGEARDFLFVSTASYKPLPPSLGGLPQREKEFLLFDAVRRFFSQKGEQPL